MSWFDGIESSRSEEIDEIDEIYKKGNKYKIKVSALTLYASAWSGTTGIDFCKWVFFRRKKIGIRIFIISHLISLHLSSYQKRWIYQCSTIKLILAKIQVVQHKNIKVCHTKHEICEEKITFKAYIKNAYGKQ